MEEVGLKNMMSKPAKDYMVAQTLKDEILRVKPEEIDNLQEFLDSGASIEDAIELIYILRLIDELHDVNKNTEFLLNLKDIIRNHISLTKLRNDLTLQLKEAREFDNFTKGRTA